MKNQPWIHSAKFDLLWFHLPSLIAIAVVFLLPANLIEQDISPWVWLVLIAGIDVSHVYSTLFRSYFHKKQKEKYKKILLLIPLICFVAAVFLYSLNGIYFWRILAYLAVFHFIRQQYGFLSIYKRKENIGRFFNAIDNIVIYSATIYPIIFWHFSNDRVFKWFVDKDFIAFNNYKNLLTIAECCYFMILTLWTISICWQFLKFKYINVPKVLWVISTCASWYIGIVYFNSDLVFTILNIVSHGIPYMALVWHYAQKDNNLEKNFLSFGKYSFNKYYGIFIFLGTLIILAITEEAIWDTFIWQEHPLFFGFLYTKKTFLVSNELKTFLIPLLALPQMVHYVLDGFIWRVSAPEHKTFL
jgi:hypothetical protein